MQRREFMTLVGGAALAWPLALRAQQGLPVIAVLGSGAADAPSSKTLIEMLDASLHELGVWRGRDYAFEPRWAGSDARRFAALAAELVALKPSAIVVSTNLAVTTVQGLSRTVPIVDTSMNAPLAAGLVKALRIPAETSPAFPPWPMTSC
jgi:putative ABC transport system substrate-binding protein